MASRAPCGCLKHCLFYSVDPLTPAFYAGALRVPVIHRAGNLLVWLGQCSKSQMDLIGNLTLFMFTEKVVLKPNDVSVFTTLTINGRLFACPREQFDSLVGVNGLRLGAECAIRKPCLQLNFTATLRLVAGNSWLLCGLFYTVVGRENLRCSLEMLPAADDLWKLAKPHHYGDSLVFRTSGVIHFIETSLNSVLAFEIGMLRSGGQWWLVREVPVFGDFCRATSRSRRARPSAHSQDLRRSPVKKGHIHFCLSYRN